MFTAFCTLQSYQQKYGKPGASFCYRNKTVLRTYSMRPAEPRGMITSTYFVAEKGRQHFPFQRATTLYSRVNIICFQHFLINATGSNIGVFSLLCFPLAPQRSYSANTTLQYQKLHLALIHTRRQQRQRHADFCSSNPLCNVFFSRICPDGFRKFCHFPLRLLQCF